MRGFSSNGFRFGSLLPGVASLGLCLALLAGTGCRLMRAREMFAPVFVPQNIYCPSPVLPAEFRRVAVLPMAADEQQSTMIAGREALEPILISALLKTRRFEVVRLAPEQMRELTGQQRWKGIELLPHDFMEQVQQSSGCNAVFLCELTTFRAYAPLAIGWRMKLIDARSRQILWAGDELFDAGESTVKNGARRYRQGEMKTPDSGEWAIENSPRLFGQYTIARLLETLPAR